MDPDAPPWVTGHVMLPPMASLLRAQEVPVEHAVPDYDFSMDVESDEEYREHEVPDNGFSLDVVSDEEYRDGELSYYGSSVVDTSFEELLSDEERSEELSGVLGLQEHELPGVTAH
ncbi:hypothetical protein Poli38472_004855 [Pythium oligandrum]|uniref:Uncharacterized protein n=1 Tax=Pythium oligandrum TaxID=41045 RepID=A0A8K1CB94_PYTOL|nr:hypothetical protein Poli38472_004855 [Pythium oligandrum]|eukprot:TMW59786.1 hypothetical protein Poli38472_004855 [Pythium oligandrum]